MPSYTPPYSPWKDQPDASTPITAAALGTMDAGISAAARRDGATFTGPVAPAVVALTDAATIAVNAAAGNDLRVTLGGNRTIGAPSNPVDGLMVTFTLTQDGTGTRTVTWASGAAGYSFGAGSAPTLSTAAGAADMIGFKYNAAKNRWLFTGAALGF